MNKTNLETWSNRCLVYTFGCLVVWPVSEVLRTGWPNAKIWAVLSALVGTLLGLFVLLWLLLWAGSLAIREDESAPKDLIRLTGVSALLFGGTLVCRILASILAGATTDGRFFHEMMEFCVRSCDKLLIPFGIATIVLLLIAFVLMGGDQRKAFFRNVVRNDQKEEPAEKGSAKEEDEDVFD